MAHRLVSQEQIDAYLRDGVVLIRGLFRDHVDTLRAGVERNMAEPGPYAAENLKPGETGRFFDDTRQYIEANTDLAPADKEKIYHGNALKVFKRLRLPAVAA